MIFELVRIRRSVVEETMPAAIGGSNTGGKEAVGEDGVEYFGDLLGRGRKTEWAWAGRQPEGRLMYGVEERKQGGGQ